MKYTKSRIQWLTEIYIYIYYIYIYIYIYCVEEIILPSLVPRGRYSLDLKARTILPREFITCLWLGMKNFIKPILKTQDHTLSIETLK